MISFSVGDHVKSDNHGRMSFGIVTALLPANPSSGEFFERTDMVKVDWVVFHATDGMSPYPFAFSDYLERDESGVVRGTLEARQHSFTGDDK